MTGISATYDVNDGDEDDDDTNIVPDEAELWRAGEPAEDKLAVAEPSS